MEGGAVVTRPSWLPELLWILATGFVAIAVVIVDLRLWKMDAHVPIFSSDGDASYYLASIKGVLEHGWFWRNPDLGAPFGQANFDFAAPFGDVMHYVIVRILGVVLGDPVVVFNAFFLLCFPLIAVTAFAVMRNLGAARAAALVAAVLFTFLPYHLLRNEAHLFLTSYYAIPLIVWLVVAVAEGRQLVSRAAPRRTLAVVAICLVAGAASNYYAVFALLVLLTVIPVAAIARRSRRIAVQGAAVTALVGLSFALCHAPAIIYPLNHGANDRVAKRQPAESELFGLKLAYMVIPRPQHRVGFMARRGKVYFATTALRSEGFEPSLGTVATLGLLAAIITLLATGIAGKAVSIRRSRIAIAGDGRVRRLRDRDRRRDLEPDRLRDHTAGARLEPALARDRVRGAARRRAAADRVRRPPARPRPRGRDRRNRRHRDRRRRRHLRSDVVGGRPRLRRRRGRVEGRRRLRRRDAAALPGRHEDPPAALYELSGERLGGRRRRLRPLQGLRAHEGPALDVRRRPRPRVGLDGAAPGARSRPARGGQCGRRLRRRLPRSRRLRRRRRERRRRARSALRPGHGRAIGERTAAVLRPAPGCRTARPAHDAGRARAGLERAHLPRRARLRRRLLLPGERRRASRFAGPGQTRG